MSTEQDIKPGRYDFSSTEAKWQRYWEVRKTFRSPNPGEAGFDSKRPKFYVLDMFPYPSGAGLHVGHPIGYCATDIIARYKRMRGFNVLHPMGFDAFGLPAEQYAVETNIHPAVTTKKNIEMYRRQLKMFGFSYDWSREIATCEPGYYRWTQWMFARMFDSWYDETCEWTGPDGRLIRGRARPISELVERLAREPNWSKKTEAQRRGIMDAHRLAYMDEIPVNWCPALGTVLANEEVDNEGRSERGGHPVYRRPLRQWMLRITKYAERLLTDLADVDWPEPIKLMQRNWIGKSVGAEVDFSLADAPASDTIRIFTTRPDTLFGATYMVLAPEHPLVERITKPKQAGEVARYVESAKQKSDLSRTAESKEKTGVFSGAFAINPVNGERIPIWIADYVLMGYGTGAIMAVPGSDTRDFEFACAFDLPIVAVVKPDAEWIEDRITALTGDLDAKAEEGFSRIAAEAVELAEAVAERRRRSRGLESKTQAVLRESVGLDRLIAHYVRHAKSWGAAFVKEGTAVNSPASGLRAELPYPVCDLNGLSTEAAKGRITAWLEQTGTGTLAVNYKLRDWLFSRQRYWGEPFPVLHSSGGETTAVADDELPVVLPEVQNFKPISSSESSASMPEPPLSRAKEWVNVQRDGSSCKRDLNTMPQWAGSCWYYLRFIDPANEKEFCSPAAERYWMPIDLYVGGAEHAVLHLLYARFWHKFLFDRGYVSTAEPFGKLFNQGMIQGFAFRDKRGLILGPDAVEERGDDQFAHRESGEPVTRIVAKMSKSLKNVVNPDEIISQYGADTFRLYEMYMGPLDSSKPWNTRDVPGLYKLCQRIWRLVVDEETNRLTAALSDSDPDEAALRMLHKTIRRVTEDLEQLKINTAIAAIFDFVNFMTPKTNRPRRVLESFVILLSPLAPHLAEELWERLGHGGSLAFEPWPAFDEKLARDDEVEIAVQVNGKIKSRISAEADADDECVRLLALADEKVSAAVSGKPVKKVIVVKNRLINFIV